MNIKQTTIPDKKAVTFELNMIKRVGKMEEILNKMQNKTLVKDIGILRSKIIGRKFWKKIISNLNHIEQKKKKT